MNTKQKYIRLKSYDEIIIFPCIIDHSEFKGMNIISAIPPENYKGDISSWIIKLMEKELWNGNNPDWYGDVMITSNDWWELLEECEK